MMVRKMAKQTALLVFCLQIMIICMKGSHSDEGTVPENVLVIALVQAGQDTTLKCDVGQYDEWWHTPNGEERFRTVSLHTTVHSVYSARFSVSDNNSLKITNIHVEDSGEYCCYDDSVGNKSCIWLAVLQNDLQRFVVKVGTNARLKCDVKLQCECDEWWHFPVGENSFRTDSKKTIVNSEYLPRFSASDDNTLLITNFHLEDAGEYCCHDETAERNFCIELIVIDRLTCYNNATEDGAVTGVDCSGNFSPDVVQHHCHTVYHGTSSPVITWVDDGISQHVSSSFEVRKDNLYSSLTQTATGSARQHSVQCNISSHVCTSSFKQQFAYNKTSVSKVTQGSINCTANASGPCSYEWTMVGNESFSIQGQVLDTSSADISHFGKYVCLATCQIRSQTCTVKATEVDYQPISEHARLDLHDDAYNVYYVYAGWFGIGVIITGIVFLIFHHLNFFKNRFRKVFAWLSRDSQQNKDGTERETLEPGCKNQRSSAEEHVHERKNRTLYND